MNFWNEGWKARKSRNNGYLTSPDTLRAHVELLNFERHFLPIFASIVYRKSPRGSLANIGPGGSEAILFRHLLPSISYFALDISLFPLTDSRDQNRGWGSYVNGTALDLPFRSNSIEFVYSVGVLHHTGDLTRCLSEVNRILVPDGIAAIGIYNSNSPMFIKTKIILGVKAFVLKHLRYRVNKQSKSKELRWFSLDEQEWKVDDETNPFTETLSRRNLEKLLQRNRLNILSNHRYSFHWYHLIPFFGKYLDKINFMNAPKPFLGRFFGGMNVVLVKKSDIS